MSEYIEMINAKIDTDEAIKWNELPNGETYCDAKFEITHTSSITLTRSGQQVCGGNNYWKSPEVLNKAIIEVIASDNTIIERAIEVIKEKERQAIIDCRSFAEELLGKVESAEAKS